jgi:hypothetical protein
MTSGLRCSSPSPYGLMVRGLPAFFAGFATSQPTPHPAPSADGLMKAPAADHPLPSGEGSLPYSAEFRKWDGLCAFCLLPSAFCLPPTAHLPICPPAYLPAPTFSNSTPVAAATSACSEFPCESMVTMAGKSLASKTHIASGTPNSSSKYTPWTLGRQRA